MNYGDLALNLPADWNRMQFNDQAYALGIVGHFEGKADVFRTDEPDTPHNFAWIDARYLDEVSMNRTKGYSFVKKSDGWEKNPDLWEWDAEGFIIHNGQKLMARSKERFLADMDKRREQRKRVMGTNAEERDALKMAQRAGIEITEDDEDKPRRKRGMRNG